LEYNQAVEFIHGIARFGPKPGLRRVQLLLDLMGNPQKQLKFIHVAGTNGKGSTCAMISHVLTQAGYKTGLYISPFVLDFRERIQVNGEMIEPEDFALSATLVKQHWDFLDVQGEPPSEFETLVVCAFDYFLRQQVDIVVLEVGMGGRLDATNIIDPPLCSVITSLGMDHMEYLGNTIDKIAFEKCGIIKPGGATVCYPVQEPAAMEVIHRRCEEEGNELIVPQRAQVLEESFLGTRMVYGGRELHLPLIGAHQVLNATVALEALKALEQRGFPASDEDVAQGIARTSFPARLEVISRDPLIVLDGAHNRDGARVLGSALDMLKGRKIHAIMGMLAAKDVAGALEEILPRCASLTAVGVPGVQDATTPEKLAELARSHCGDVSVFEDPDAGLAAAFTRRSGDDVLLVCGSLYLASHLRPKLFKLR